ncbi:MAG TPA: DUF4147 domain-containing protein, partial [Deinococcales bacterium]|nr:DUF4147 domain-containing protein [Deinococcales bacterium]
MRDLLRSTLLAAVAASGPERATARALAALTPPVGRLVVVSVGKAALGMARAAAAWRTPDAGLVVSPRGAPGAPPPGWLAFEAGHPVPDDGSVRAAQASLQAVRGLGPDDLVLVLLSGGGSALLCAPLGL